MFLRLDAPAMLRIDGVTDWFLLPHHRKLTGRVTRCSPASASPPGNFLRDGAYEKVGGVAGACIAFVSRREPDVNASMNGVTGGERPAPVSPEWAKRLAGGCEGSVPVRADRAAVTKACAPAKPFWATAQPGVSHPLTNQP